jgi:signal transduction histidine kinase/DNA-binding response OmpR family regulator
MRQHDQPGPDPRPSPMSLFSGDGEMRALMRATDWSRTRLGPVEEWPNSLRTMLGVVLGSRFPMLLWWGPDLLHLYNDAYRPILRDKHPGSLAAPAAEIWAEVWEVAGPLARSVLDGGPATWTEDLQLFIHSGGMAEETYFTFSYSPVPGDDGRVGGVLNTVQETTAKVRGDRQIRMLHELAARAPEARSEVDAYRISAEVLAKNELDLPFVLLYALREKADRARLTALGGLGAYEGPARADEIPLDETASSASWPLAEVIRSGREAVVHDLSSRFGFLPRGRWNARPETAIVLPLRRTGEAAPCAVLVAGVSPHRVLDAPYLRFFRATADQVMTVIANARAYETERRRAEALADIDRAKSAFFSNVSHELRTPLTLILGPAERMLTSPDSPEAWRHELEVVVRNARTLLKHVDDLLDVARLEAGKVKLAYADLDLAHAVRLAASHFDILAQEKPVTFHLDAAQAVEAQVDGSKFQRVVLNLLSNAFKFTPPGGSIRCTLRAYGGEAHLEVADSGPGIAPELREVVFERFRQLDGGATRCFGGTGLGLAIAREFVELHGGSIAVSTAPEGGALFTVRLPLRAPDAAMPDGAMIDERPLDERVAGDAARQVIDELRPIQAPARPAADSAEDAPTILVVEDNVEMNDFIRQSLANGHRFLVAGDGETALRAALESKPDLIISDVMMPRMSGDELVRAVRQHAELDAVPIVVLTARADDELRVRLLREGAQDFLNKPFSADELRVRAGNLIAMKRTRDTLQREFASQTDDLEELSREVADRRRALEAALGQLRQKEELQRFLATATAMLAESLDYKKTLARVASLAVPTFADWCMLDLLEDDRRIRRAEVAHADPGLGALAAAMMPFSVVPDGNPDYPGTKVLLDGGPVLIEHVTEADLRGMAHGEDRYFELLEAAGVVSVISVPVVAHGRTLGILTFSMAQSGRHYADADLVVAQDIARRCALAMENARLFQEARAAIHVRDEFLSIASHELRTPLTPLQIQVHTLAQRIVEFVQADKQAWLEERLETIRRQTRRLDRLVSELLDISRILGGKLNLDLESVDLCDVVRTVVADLREQGNVDRSRVDLHVDLDGSIVGHWDRTRIEQVVSGLLSNAIKFGGGQPITIAATTDARTATLVVRDQGVGIAPADQERIFDRFERAVSVRNYGGLGLGLFIARQVVEAMGGTIRVRSQLGQGATFTVTLPRAGAKPIGDSNGRPHEHASSLHEQNEARGAVSSSPVIVRIA